MPKDNALQDFIRTAKKIVIEDLPAEIAKAQGGDKEALHRVVMGNVGLAAKAAYRYMASGAAIGLEPLEVLMIAMYGPKCDGTSGLAKAIMAFNLKSENKLSTYAVFWLRDALQEMVRDSTVKAPGRRAKGRVSMFEFNPDVPREMVSDDIAPTTEADLDRKKAEEQLRLALAKLPPRTRLIMARRFGNGDASTALIAEELGVSPQRIRQIIDATLDWLRGELGEYAGQLAFDLD